MKTIFVCESCSTRVKPLDGHPQCPKCGGLFLVEHSFTGDKKRTKKAWHELLTDRAATSQSGVWRYRDWVLPELKDKDVVTLGEGRSPLVDVEIDGRRVFVKQCGQQPTGSFKDLGMTVLVSAAHAIAKKKRETRTASSRVTLVCASTGDTSAALAAYGARANMPVLVLLPRGKVSKAQLLQPLANGARVLELDGDFDACMRVVADIGKRDGFFLANSKNPLRLLGQMTVAFEIWQDLNFTAPDVVVVPSGNLGNVYAIMLGFDLLERLKLIDKRPRLVAAQAAAADPLHRWAVEVWRTGEPAPLTPVTAGETLATAIRIGDPVSFPRAKVALARTGGTTTSSSEQQIIDGMRVLDRQGLLACPQTGTAVDGARQLIATKGALKKHDVVVVVSTASGLKFIDSKADVEVNAPERVPANVDAVVAALARGAP
jgi:threonine synthase